MDKMVSPSFRSGEMVSPWKTRFESLTHKGNKKGKLWSGWSKTHSHNEKSAFFTEVFMLQR